MCPLPTGACGLFQQSQGADPRRKHTTTSPELRQTLKENQWTLENRVADIQTLHATS
jgi:hypothetical protein